MVSIITNLSCSCVRDSMKSARLGIFQAQVVNFVHRRSKQTLNNQGQALRVWPIPSDHPYFLSHIVVAAKQVLWTWKIELQGFKSIGTQGDQFIFNLMSPHLICLTKNLKNLLPYFIWWCQSIKMEKEVSGYTQTQETIGLIPPVVPFNILCSCIGLYFSCHSNPVEAFCSQQYLHLCFLFKEIKWSQDDLLRLIYSSEIVPSISRMLPINDVEPTKQIGRR